MILVMYLYYLNHERNSFQNFKLLNFDLNKIKCLYDSHESNHFKSCKLKPFIF